MKVPNLAVVVAAAALPLVIAGCSGSAPSPGSKSAGSGPGADATSGTGSGTGTVPSGSGGSAAQLTGAELTKSLLPASDFPAKFAVSQQGSADSGASLENAAASYNPATMACADWDNYFTSAGFGETAYTTQSVSDSTAGQTYGQVVYQFPSAGAASAFFSGVRSLSARCHSFTASGGGSGQITMQLTAASSVAGHQAFWLDQSAAVAGATSQSHTLFTMAGTDVFAVAASGVGSAPPDDPAPATLLQQLIGSVAAHH
jgi:hypothetical protein